MITVVRLASNYYTAYCPETGFLVHGCWFTIARALRRIGMQIKDISSILTELQHPDYSEEPMITPLVDTQGTRLKLRTRHA